MDCEGILLDLWSTSLKGVSEYFEKTGFWSDLGQINLN